MDDRGVTPPSRRMFATGINRDNHLFIEEPSHNRPADSHRFPSNPPQTADRLRSRGAPRVNSAAFSDTDLRGLANADP